MNELVGNAVKSVAATSIGMSMIKITDKFLWTLEKSVQWSLPPQETQEDENGKVFGTAELVRPLPWVLFLPYLILLRVFRTSVNIIYTIFGFPEFKPTDMMQAVQSTRRQLRALKFIGIKSMRSRRASSVKDRTTSIKEASKSLAKSIRLTLSTLSCLDSGFNASPSPPPTQIRVSNFFDTVTLTEEKSHSESESKNRDQKRRYSETVSDDSDDISPENEKLLEMIDRLAEVPSDEDPDYNPDESSTTSVSYSESSIDSEEEKVILNSKNEMEDGKMDSNSMKLPAAVTNEKETNSISQESKWEKKPDQTAPTTNGVTDEDNHVYHSPISYRSVSPEVSIPDSIVKQNDESCSKENARNEPEEMNNGAVVHEENEKENDSSNRAIGTVEEIINGDMKTKQQMITHGGGKNHQQKNKRGGQTNRKKK